MMGLAFGTIAGAVALVAGIARESDPLMTAAVVATLLCLTGLLIGPGVILWRMLVARELHPAIRQVRQSALLGASLLGLIGVVALFRIPLPILVSVLMILLGLAGLGIWIAAGARARAAPAMRGMAYGGAMGVALVLSLIIAATANKWGC